MYISIIPFGQHITSTRRSAILQYNTTYYRTIQHITVQYNILPYNTKYYRTIQHITVQYNILTYNTAYYQYKEISKKSLRIENFVRNSADLQLLISVFILNKFKISLIINISLRPMDIKRN